MLKVPRYLRAFLPFLAPRLPAHAAEQQAKLRGLVRLPCIASDFEYKYDLVDGYTFHTGADIPQDTPEALRKTLRGDADDAITCYRIGNLFLRDGRREEAKAAFEQSVALYQEQVRAAPDDGAKRAHLVLALHQAQRKNERDKAMADALTRAPNEAQVWSVRAEIAFADAYAMLSGQAEYLPADKSPYYLATLLKRLRPEAELRAALDLLEQAKTAYNIAVAAAPDGWHGYSARWMMAPFYQIGTRLLNRGLQSKAVVEEDQDSLTAEFIGLRIQGNSVRDLITAAQNSRENPLALGMAANMLVYCAVQRNPEPLDALNVGVMQQLPEDEQTAAYDLLTRLETLAHSANSEIAGYSALMLGMQQWALLSPEPARAALCRARTLLPHNSHVVECLASYWMTEQRYADVEDMLQEALRQRESARWRLLLAKAQERQNRWEGVEQNVRLVLKSQPKNLDANLAQCAILLHKTTVDTNVYPILDQINLTHTLMGPDATVHQEFSLHYLIGIYYGLLGMGVDARECLRGVYCRKDQYADVEAVAALLP